MSKKYEHELVTTTPPFPFMINSWDHFTGRFFFPTHWHQAIEINYTAHGTLTHFNVMGKEYQTETGKIMVVNTGQLHYVDGQVGPEDKGVVILFPYSFVVGLFPQISQYKIVINDPQNFTTTQAMKYRDLQATLAKLDLAFNSNDQYRKLTILKLATTVLSLLITNFAEKQVGQEQTSKKDYQIKRLLALTEYVNIHYQETISLKELAHQCGLSSGYLPRFFKQMMGVKISEYISSVRAQHAYDELYQRKGNLTELALNNGFSGIRTLNRAIKRFYGQTASEIYRKLQKKHQ